MNYRSKSSHLFALVALAVVTLAIPALAAADVVSWGTLKGHYDSSNLVLSKGAPDHTPASENAAGGVQGRPTVWADCELFQSVVTPNSFKPTAGNFDQAYTAGNVGGSFGDGVPLISDAKPGDQDFNGGRWHVNVLRGDVDPAKYMDACSFEDLDPADFVSTSNYFECPLLPRRGNNK